MDIPCTEHLATQLSSLFHTFVLIILNTTNNKKTIQFLHTHYFVIRQFISALNKCVHQSGL